MLKNLGRSEKILVGGVVGLFLVYFVGKLLLSTLYLPTLDGMLLESQLFGWMFLMMSATGRYFISPYNLAFSLAGLATMAVILVLFKKVPLWRRIIYAYLIGVLITAFQTLSYFPR